MSSKAWCFLAAGVGVSFLCGLTLGTQTLWPWHWFSSAPGGDPHLAGILWHWRFPRAVTAFLVGACLGVGGLLLQGVFRNPLAEPYLLGSAAGASVGAAASLLAPLPWPQTATLPLFSFLGAWGASWVVLLLSGFGLARWSHGILLAGVAVAAILGAVRGLLLLSFADTTNNLQMVMSWMLGGVQTPPWHECGVLALLTAATVLLAATRCRGLDLLGFGEPMAEAMGLPVRSFVRNTVLIAALATALAVAWGGLIGFIGLIIPHLCRWFGGCRHGVLLPIVLLTGGSAVVLLDGAARSLLPPGEIPVGLISALIGGPFFLAVLWRQRM